MVVQHNDTPAGNPSEDTMEKSRQPDSTSLDEAAPEVAGEIGDVETDPADELEKLRHELAVQEQRATEAGERLLRAQAELDNVRKRSSRDIENAHKYALDKFVAELLPVLDSLELGISAAENTGDVSGLKEGMDLTLKKFADVLDKFGVVVIDPQGERFNPEKHEAVSMQAEEGVESGMVISVMQKGYELNGRLIRPAMVMVSG